MGADYEGTVERQLESAPITAEDLANYPMILPMPLGGEWCLLRYYTARTGNRVILTRSPEALLGQWRRVLESTIGHPHDTADIQLRSLFRIETLGPSPTMRKAYARRLRSQATNRFWATISVAADVCLAASGVPPQGLSPCPGRSPDENGVSHWLDRDSECTLCRFGWVPAKHLGRPVSEWAASFFLARRHRSGAAAISSILAGSTKEATETMAPRVPAPGVGAARDATDDEARNELRVAWLEDGPHAPGVCLSDTQLGPYAIHHDVERPLFFYRILGHGAGTLNYGRFHDAKSEVATKKAGAVELEAQRRSEELREREAAVAAEAERIERALAELFCEAHDIHDTHGSP